MVETPSSYTDPTATDDEGKDEALRLLLVANGVGQVRVLPPIAEIVIGRAPESTVQIDHPSVSRRHCLVHQTGEVSVEDLGSANGTRAAGAVIERKRTPVLLGAPLEIGKVHAMLLRLRSEPDADLVVSEQGRWFQCAGAERVDLEKRQHIGALLLTLALHRIVMPETSVSTESLIRAGWPGEKLLKAAAAVRVRVALATLRKIGLRSLLSRRSGGYFLDVKTVELAPERAR